MRPLEFLRSAYLFTLMERDVLLISLSGGSDLIRLAAEVDV